MQPSTNDSVQGAALADIVSDVLGDLAFLISDDHAPEPEAGTAWLTGQIGYRGPFVGELTCFCTENFARQLVANLLGEEAPEDQPLQQAGDAVRELLNVICGQLVTSRFGEEEVFNLTIPQIAPIDAPEVPAVEGRDDCILGVNGEPFICRHAGNAGS